MLQERTVLSAVLDRTMFRFHRSTTWLDQAQRKAPRQLVRVKVRKQRQREDRSSEEAAWRSGSQSRPPPSVISASSAVHWILPKIGAPPPCTPPQGDSVGQKDRWEAIRHSQLSWQMTHQLHVDPGLDLQSLPHPTVGSDMT